MNRIFYEFKTAEERYETLIFLSKLNIKWSGDIPIFSRDISSVKILFFYINEGYCTKAEERDVEVFYNHICNYVEYKESDLPTLKLKATLTAKRLGFIK